VTTPLEFAVIGEPIAHSRSPRMHGAAFAVLGLPHRYGAFLVAPEHLGAAVRGAAALGFRGLNVTVPHKVTVAAHLDVVDDVARAVGAVNTILFEDGTAQGHNTDVAGFLQALRELDARPPQHAVVLGGGGAAHAVVHALRTAFPGVRVTRVTRRPGAFAGADDLASLSWADFARTPEPFDLVVNATSVGMVGGGARFPVELPWPRLSPGGAAVDLVVAPDSEFLPRAAAAGGSTQDGRPMLLWQGVRALELWLGEDLPPRAIAAMRAALE
jgi:shikimate dehydrogenase